MGTGVLSTGKRGRDVKLTTHILLVARTRMRGSIPPLTHKRVYPKVSGLAAWSEN
jgi:hypothetical protein